MPTMSTARLLLSLAVAACACSGAAVRAAEGPGDVEGAAVIESMRQQGVMPPLDGAVAWLNSAPLTPESLRGKVVLVDFWTYTCINWQRTLPHVRAWADKYRDHGLVVVGVHTPEFSFEEDLERVRRATAQLGVTYPVAVDSRREVWRAFRNEYWPALYFVDARGQVRHHAIGEGDYERSERVIQHLLREAGAASVPTDLVRVRGTGTQAEADWKTLRTNETYVGWRRAGSFALPQGLVPDRPAGYTAPRRLKLNTWALAGDWTVGGESALLVNAPGRIVHKFHARDLHLVMGPSATGAPVPFRVRIDGKPPGVAHGGDVDPEGRGIVTGHRLYQLIREPRMVDDRQFEIEFEAPGVEVYAFTFG